MASVDDIVEKLPPPEKLPKVGADDAAEPEGGDADYSAEEDAGMQVASALGVDPDKVDVKALCEALKSFNAITKV